MAAIKFTNSLNHEQILNLDLIITVEKTFSHPALIMHSGHEKMHINFKSNDERDRIFEEICRQYGV